MSPETIAIVISTVGAVLTLFAGLGAMLAWVHKNLKADTATASAAVRSEMLVRFDRIDERFAMVDARFDRIDERFEKVDERFDKMDERFDKVDERFEKVGAECKEVRSELESVKISVARIEGPLPRFLPTTRR
ncbi:MAG TPA: hypothetical protein H9830_12975 [Candidatus Agrococcus pullicola]|uniref:Uncharacterized protein n=1 Tax=Candidatus Agrococcus pullicola TaxID=2838429 RepID=A0A9D1YXM4_9MICO|nr:hypothetical protein [Candidatus Agrococcus pullicola]